MNPGCIWTIWPTTAHTLNHNTTVPPMLWRKKSLAMSFPKINVFRILWNYITLRETRTPGKNIWLQDWSSKIGLEHLVLERCKKANQEHWDYIWRTQEQPKWAPKRPHLSITENNCNGWLMPGGPGCGTGCGWTWPMAGPLPGDPRLEHLMTSFRPS